MAKVIVLIGLVLGLVGELQAEQLFSTCSTPACNEAAHFIESSLNASVDPCEDFYEFSCGGWEASHELPAFKSHTGVTEELEEQILNQIHQLVASFNLSDSDTVKRSPPSVAYSAHMFQQCLATGSQPSSVGIDYLREVVQDILGEQWNVGKARDERKSRAWYENYVQAYSHGGLEPVFGISIEVDARNVSQKLISIDPSSLGLEDNELANLTRNVKVVAAYRKLMLQSAQLLCLNGTEHKCPSEAALEADIKELIQLEHLLATAKPPMEDDRDPEKNYHQLTIGELSERTDFDWLGKLIAPIWQGLQVKAAPPTNETLILASDLVYLEDAIDILNIASPRVIDNYFGWQAVASFSGASSESFREVAFNFRKVVSGVTKQTDRWRTCMGMTLGWAVSRLFVDHYFSPKEKLQASIIIDEIQRSFVQLLVENEWLDEETRNASISKLLHVKKNVAYPDWLLNNAELTEFHGLQSAPFAAELLAEKNYLRNNLRLGLTQQRHDFEDIHKPIDLDKDWPMSPHVVNAAYQPEQNSITIPAAQLKPPFFNADFPFAINYGNIGATVGHELTHGLDDEGRQFDEEGNLDNWWSNEAVKRFANRSHCFVKQYGSQKEPDTGLKLDGQNTLGENIADNGGLHEAFHAYQSHVAKLGPSPRLAALQQYSSEQLFFISYGNSWCSKQRLESKRNQIEYDPHAPAKYRVNIPVSNSEDFAKAFNCPAGSKMNPAHKCQLW